MKQALQDNWKFIIMILIVIASGWLIYIATIEIPQERIQAGITKAQYQAQAETFRRIQNSVQIGRAHV